MVERTPATGLLTPSHFEVNPFTITSRQQMGTSARDSIGFYALRWITTLQLVLSIAKALCKRGKLYELLYIDTYQDLKLEIAIVILQFVSLVLIARTMLSSSIAPSNLSDEAVASKFWLLRG